MDSGALPTATPGSGSPGQRGVSLFLDLPLVLTWRCRQSVPASLELWFDNLLSCRLENTVTTFPAHSPIRQQFKRLPWANRQRIARAPSAYRWLGLSGGRVDTLLASWVAAEARVADGQLAGGTETVWTAMGDVAFSIAAREDRESPSTVITSPRLYNGLVVDVASPFSWPEGHDSEDFVKHSDEEVSEIVSKLTLAMRLIDGVSSEASQVIRRYLKVVGLRRDRSSSHAYGSSSWGKYVGLVGLTNAHSRHCSVPQLANALTHEAIHSLLYVVEAAANIRLDRAPDLRSRTIQSPWSGRYLPLPSFIHACFVWYGLYHFWSLAGLDDPAFRSLGARARSGFLESSLGAALSEAAPDVLEELVVAVDVMQDEVVGAGGNGS